MNCIEVHQVQREKKYVFNLYALVYWKSVAEQKYRINNWARMLSERVAVMIFNDPTIGLFKPVCDNNNNNQR